MGFYAVRRTIKPKNYAEFQNIYRPPVKQGLFWNNKLRFQGACDLWHARVFDSLQEYCDG